MTSAQEIGELLERVKGATEGTVELDARLWCAVNGKRFKEAWEGFRSGRQTFDVMFTEPPKRTELVENGLPRYSSSIDAALGLVERCLPGAEYEISTLYHIAAVELPLNGDECARARREDMSVPLAIIEALLVAMQHQSTAPVDGGRDG